MIGDLYRLEPGAVRAWEVLLTEYGASGELATLRWDSVPGADAYVVVRDGMVDLWGTITDERERQALIVAAENVPGVKRVNDHLAWIEPMSGMVLEPQGETTEIPKAS